MFVAFTGVSPAWTVGRKRICARLCPGVGCLAAASAGVVLAVPLAWAGKLDPCAAAEVALVDEVVGRGSRFAASKARVANWTRADGSLVSHGRVGRRIAAEEHPGCPSVVGCTALFWRVRSEGASVGGITPILTRVLSLRR